MWLGSSNSIQCVDIVQMALEAGPQAKNIEVRPERPNEACRNACGDCGKVLRAME